jgi:hypothetical protein
VTVPLSWKKEIDTLENNAVNKSDFRLAVSEELVSYWRNRYHYQSNSHVVIPCTLNNDFTPPAMDDESIAKTRINLGYTNDDVILAYSGSAAGWQSFNVLYGFLKNYLSSDSHYKVMFLSPDDENIQKLIAEFPNQVSRKWVAHQEVPAALACCDYGVLLREQSVTNQVASPTKFAEYLSSGLPVLISKGLGDYSAFTAANDCGYVLAENEYPALSRTTQNKRTHITSLVQQYCTKEAYLSSYKTMITTLQ